LNDVLPTPVTEVKLGCLFENGNFTHDKRKIAGVKRGDNRAGVLAVKSFYFVRHGLTDANHQKLLCGADWDIPLHADGHAQAAQSAAEFRKTLASVRTICCSPLLRARQTADYFARELQIPIVIVDELREQRLGDWERKPWADVPEFFAGKNPPQGETLEEFDTRVKQALSSALQHDEPVLIVSHGAFWYALNRVLGLQPEPPGSCSVFYFQSASGWTRSRII
jgi:broad specificity phosphatase PhoE